MTKQISKLSNGFIASGSYSEDKEKNMYLVLEIKYSGPGFDMADAKRINADMFSFNPNELHGGGGSAGGTGSGLGQSLTPLPLIIDIGSGLGQSLTPLPLIIDIPSNINPLTRHWPHVVFATLSYLFVTLPPSTFISLATKSSLPLFICYRSVNRSSPLYRLLNAPSLIYLLSLVYPPSRCLYSLGLSLAKFIAEAHGGHVCVQSEGPKKGTSLVLELPLSVGSEANVNVNVNVNAVQNNNLVPIPVQPTGVLSWRVASASSLNQHRSSRGNLVSLVSDREGMNEINEINENKDATFVGGDSVREVRDVLGEDFDEKMVQPSLVLSSLHELEYEEESEHLTDPSEKDKNKGNENDYGSENDQINNLTKAQAEKKDDDSFKVVSIAGSHVLVVEDSAAARKVHMTHPLMYTYRHDTPSHVLVVEDSAAARKVHTPPTPPLRFRMMLVWSLKTLHCTT